MIQLSICYENGKGVKQNYVEAVEWYVKVAEQGDVNVQVKLGDIFYNGQAIPKNNAIAERWYRMAAEKGNEKAKLALNNMGVIW